MKALVKSFWLRLRLRAHPMPMEPAMWLQQLMLESLLVLAAVQTTPLPVLSANVSIVAVR